MRLKIFHGVLIDFPLQGCSKLGAEGQVSLKVRVAVV